MRLEQWCYALPLRLRALFHRRQVERELDEGLRYHIEQQIQENLAAGMNTKEAHHAALRALGGLERRKDECRSAWGVAVVDRLRVDTAYALRALHRDLVFTLGVVLILAVGIGADASVFAIVDGVLLRPLPYHDPDSLVVIEELRPPKTTPVDVNPLHFREWQRKCRCFDEIALSTNGDVNLTGAGAPPKRISHASVTPNLFAMLGVRAELGRTFLPADAQAEKQVVLISDALWHRRFGGDPDIVGKTLGVDGADATIVGVLPPSFRDYHPGVFGPAAGHRRIDVFSPWAVKPSRWQHWNNNYSYAALARLAGGVSLQAASDELNRIQASIDERYDTGSRSGTLGAVLIPLQQWVTSGSRADLFLLLGAVGAAFLVACLNIASLMLVRATGRSREAGVRAALGASSLQIFRGVLIESGLLALAGAALGIALAAGFLHFFTAFAPARLPRIHEVHMDWAVPLVGLGLGVAATLAFGLLPALRMTHIDPQDALRSDSRAFTSSRSQSRLRQGLVTLEVGLSTGLLIVAGLLIMSFVRLDGVDRGYDSTHVLTADVGLAGSRYGYGKVKAKRHFLETLVERLEAAPGIEAVGLTSVLPLRGDRFGSHAIPEGEARQPESWPSSVQYRFVSPGYFKAMGAPLLAGRAFSAQDAPRNVAVVSERLAKLLSANGEASGAIGRRFYPNDPKFMFEVVGVVPDVHTDNLASDPVPIAYVPLLWGAFSLQGPPIPTVALRTVGDPAAAASLLRDTVHGLDPGIPISNVQTMQQIDAAASAQRRFQLILITAFGAASLLVAALGIYSVLAYAVTNRTREIAIRMALGARTEEVRRMILREGMRPVLIGLGLGTAAALAFGRLLSSLLYSVSPTDPMTLLAVVAITLATALLASWMPARCAARTPLLDALRYE